MSPATFLAGLYPPAVRDRWGADLRDEVASTGITSWPDTIAGAARLWLHPSDWPEISRGETRRTVTVMVFTILAVTVLLLRTVDPTATLTADFHHPVTSLWLAPLLLGSLLAAPLPPMRGDALRRLVATAVRTLTAPAAAVLAMFVVAWSGLVQHPTGVADAAALAYYWGTLGFVALRSCVLVARAARTVSTPSTRRLSVALLSIGTALALATGQSLAPLAGAGPGPTSIVRSLILGLLAAAALSAGQDLRTAR